MTSAISALQWYCLNCRLFIRVCTSMPCQVIVDRDRLTEKCNSYRLDGLWCTFRSKGLVGIEEYSIGTTNKTKQKKKHTKQIRQSAFY